MSEAIQNQLDSLETTGPSRPPSTYRKFCKTYCEAELLASRELYTEFGLSSHRPYTERFDQCRTGAWFARHKESGKVKVLSSSCKLRWCPMCASTRRWFITQQVSNWFETIKKPKFLTLTLSHTTAPLDSQIQFLYDSFRSLRKKKLIKSSVSGGVWFFQIKKSEKDKCWHPHLHCVIDSEYIDKFKLSELWARITLTSKIVDIRKVDDEEKMAEYVARYSARPALLESLDMASRLELVSSLHGRRLVGTWGNARAISLRPGKPPDADQWIKVGEWWSVVNLIDDDYRAKAIWLSFVTDSSLPENINMKDIEDQIDNIQKFPSRTVDDNLQMLLDFY